MKTLQKNLWLGHAFSSAQRGNWYFNGDIAGEYYSLETFAFLIVRKSGHLLPGDLPDTALELFDRFLEGRTGQNRLA